MGSMIGLGIISLLLYVGIILFLTVKLKRRASEAMLWAYLIIVVVAGLFSKHSMGAIFVKSSTYGIHSQVVYAAMAFVFMSYLMEKTGVILKARQYFKQHYRSFSWRKWLCINDWFSIIWDGFWFWFWERSCNRLHHHSLDDKVRLVSRKSNSYLCWKCWYGYDFPAFHINVASPRNGKH